MELHHLSVSRTARYYTLGPTGSTPEEAWFAFHGYGFEAARFARALQPLDDGRRLIVVPEALSRFYLQGTGGRIGASWMTREDREAEIRDYVGYLDRLHDTLGTNAATVHLLGFSQGSATACRWVALGRIRPARLIIWGGEIPPDLDWDASADRFQRLEEVVLVTGTTDPYTPPAALELFAEQLAQRRVPTRQLVYEGGHHLDSSTLIALATGRYTAPPRTVVDQSTHDDNR